MESLELVLLKNKDEDLAYIEAIHLLPKINEYIQIDDKYFDNVINNDNIWYYKLMLDKKVIGAIHVEKNEEVLYLSIWIHPVHQRQGYAHFCLESIIEMFSDDILRIEVKIDQANIPSISLFEKFGFKIEHMVDGIYYYVKRVK